MSRDQLIFGLNRLAAAARQRDWAIGERAGLTPTQGEIVRLLATRPNGIRLGTIAAQLSTTMATVSDAISTLVTKGFVTKLPDPDDGRAVLVSNTETATALLGELPSGFDLVVDVLPAADQAAMLNVVSHAIRSLQRAGRIAPQRLCITCKYFVRDAYPHAVERHHCAFVDAPFGDPQLRIDCAEHEGAETA